MAEFQLTSDTDDETDDQQAAISAVLCETDLPRNPRKRAVS
jgi:hypothetical protein